MPNFISEDAHGIAKPASRDLTYAEYIANGPIMSKCGLDTTKVDRELPEWRELAETLIKRLEFESEAKLSDDDRYKHDSAGLLILKHTLQPGSGAFTGRLPLS